MSPLHRIVVALLLVTPCGHAFAQRDDFQVSIRVLPERAANGSPVDIPMPPNARLLPPGRGAKRLLFDGSPGEARRFYADTLPELGFHRARQTTHGEVWERADVRAELRFYPVVGGRDATGILLMVSPRLPG